jgi:predicted GNAT family acetyltransferase
MLRNPLMADIRHDPAARRFTTEAAGGIAYITYREGPGQVLDFDHTFVPPTARGRGIASQLTAHALEYARDGGYQVVPSCPYVATYIERHAEYRDLLA